MDTREEEKVLARLLARSLRHTLKPAAPDCPEADTLAACYQRSLSDSEMARWEVHFAACERCQQVLAALAVSDTSASAQLAAASAPASRPEAGFAARPAGTSWLGFGPWWLDWRWLAPAGAAVAVLAVWIASRPAPPHALTPASQIAQKTEPAPTVKETPAETRQELARNIPPPAPKDKSLSREKRGTSSLARGTESLRAEMRESAPQTEAQAKPGAIHRDAKRLSVDSGIQQNVPAGAAPAVAGGVRQQPMADERERMDEARPKQQAEADKIVAAQAPTSKYPFVGSSGPIRVGQKSEEGAFAKSQPGEVAPAAGMAAKLEDSSKERLKKGPESKTAVTQPRAEKQGVDRMNWNEAFRPAQIVVPTPGNSVQWRIGPLGKIEHSRNAGGTWRAQPSGVDADLMAGSAPSETVCWVVGRAGTILRTTDGERWGKVPSPAPLDWTGVEARDALHAAVFAAAGNQRYVTTDGGRTWRAQ